MTNIDDNMKCVGDSVSAVQLSAGCSLGMWATLSHTGPLWDISSVCRDKLRFAQSMLLRLSELGHLF